MVCLCKLLFDTSLISGVLNLNTSLKLLVVCWIQHATSLWHVSETCHKFVACQSDTPQICGVPVRHASQIVACHATNIHRTARGCAILSLFSLQKLFPSQLSHSTLSLSLSLSLSPSLYRRPPFELRPPVCISSLSLSLSISIFSSL
jgi:hypothetical protein